MTRYIVRRFLQFIPVLFAVTLSTFVLVRVIPGGPFDRVGDKTLPPEIVANLEAKYHLDEPYWKQYARFLYDLLVPRILTEQPTSMLEEALVNAIKHGNRAGMLRALAVTGGVITSAGIVLAATFSALALLPLLFLFQIAFIVATGVLIDTLIVRSLVVPSSVSRRSNSRMWR